MWRIIKGIGRGLRSVRPSQCCPQDCTDGAPNYHLHNDEQSKVHKITLKYSSAASSWSPLTVTRCDNSLKQVAFGVTHPKDIYNRFLENGGPRADVANNKCNLQRCPPWHWHVLQDSKMLEESCSEEHEKWREKQSKEDTGNTWQYQDWKEVLQASPTLHTIGLGSAAALTLSLYRNWSEHYSCPYTVKDEHQQTPIEACKKHNIKSNCAEDKSQKNGELFWSYYRPFKNFNSEVHSQELSSDMVDKDCSKVSNETPNDTSNTLINNNKPDVITSAENEAQGSTVPLHSLQQNSLNLATIFFNIQGNVGNKNKMEEVKKNEIALNDDTEIALNDDTELLFCPQTDKSDVTDRNDSGCVSDLHEDFLQLQTSTNSGVTKDQNNENVENNTNRTMSVTDFKRPVLIEPDLQVEIKDSRGKYSQGSKLHKEPEKHYADCTTMNTLHDRLLEIVKADRTNQLQEVFKKGENTLLDTNPEEAVVYFQAGVMMGDPSAAFNLALCYQKGYGITQDLEKVRKLYEAATAAGHGWAIYNLAVMISQGLGGPCVPRRAHSLLQQAAKMGITEAIKALSALEIEKQEQGMTYEEPQLRKCYSEPSLHSLFINQQSFSHSTDDLQSQMYEDIWTASDFSTDVICQKNITNFM